MRIYVALIILDTPDSRTTFHAQGRAIDNGPPLVQTDALEDLLRATDGVSRQFPQPSMDRRHFLKHLAGLSAFALPGGAFLQTLRAASGQLRKEHKSLIILWMTGGPPTIDLWDLKPESSNGGEFKPIKTTAPGIEICEHLPLCARQMKHLSIIRSLSTSEGDHQRGRVLMHTARRPDPAVQFPSIGSVVSNQLTPEELALPGFISVNGATEGPGFLGMNYAAFTVQDPSRPPENLKPPDIIGTDFLQSERVRRRQRLFYEIEDHFIGQRRGDAAQAHSDVYKKAFNLVASPLGKVFNISSEKKNLLEDYGANNFGRGCLLARRLVEAGVPVIEVDLGGWDLHQRIFPTLKNERLPVLDRGMSALVRDLVDRGLWSSTVLLWMGEFGRTPHINANAGRDHWPRCWSVVIGGGTLKGGRAFGATDAPGTDIKGDERASVGDLFATVYHALGIDPALKIRDPQGRPLAIAEGKPIATLA
jgi:hypothetical protein